MHYIQYKRKDDNFREGYVDAVGDRAVVIIDGRESREKWHEDAVRFNESPSRGFDAYEVMIGASFLRSQPLTGIIKLK